MLPRPLVVFVGVVLLGFLVNSWVAPMLGQNDWYWIVVFVGAAVAATAARRPAGAGRRSPDGSGDGFSASEFLCDSCKYDHPDLCGRPERPNATQCPDYKRQ